MGFTVIPIENILKYAKKNNIIPGIHNQTPEYAIKMIEMGFQFVTVGSDKRFISAGAKSVISKLRNVEIKKETKT